MNVTQLKIGSRLEFELASSLEGKKGFTYVSQLLEIVDTENIIIATPIQNGRVIFVPINYAIRAYTLDTRLGLLGFAGIVTGKTVKDNIPVLFVQVKGPVEQEQRRKFYRLDAILNANYRILPEQSESESAGEEAEPEFKKALTRNLSGSGACIVAPEPAPAGSVIEVAVMLDSTATVKFKGRVMRCSKIGTGRLEKFEIGIHFTEISKNDHNSIIKYIFDQQRRLLQRGIMDKDRF